MPVVFIEAPPGICEEAKSKLVEDITTAIEQAYHIGDTLTSRANTRLKTWPWTAACNLRTPPEELWF